ncbi:MAG: hypothetical protein EOR01_23530 [Mesorhizobium sp.]|nr:MAG: hypothetical protein EOR01_23530 [Mesorhizobium sp.]
MAQISPLRQRMIEDLTIRNLSPETQRSYVHHVAKFSRFFGRSPDQLGYEEVRAYQAHLVGRRVSWGALNQTVCALRFFKPRAVNTLTCIGCRSHFGESSSHPTRQRNRPCFQRQ